MNSSVYAMKMLQKEMKGETENAGLNSEDDIMDLVKDVRKKIEGL
ncbi:MAG: hypothetical protein ACOX8P_07060 [Tepidanaerobacteraceae bacterium]|jgi:antitoxin PrlF